MKKLITITAICLVTATAIASIARYRAEVFSKIKLTSSDIPQGFIIGKIPPAVKKVLKANPWQMDRAAIKRLSRHIYPGGNYNKITGIHMTIMANARHPYGDDIVCYAILYRDEPSALGEIKKLKDFVGYNNDRAILIEKENLAVYLHVDSTSDYHHIQAMAEVIRKRIQ